MRYGIKDKLADFFRNAGEKLSLSKESWIHIGLAVMLAVGIGAGVSVGVSPNTDAINQDINRLDESDQSILDMIDDLEDSDSARTLILAALNSTLAGQVASIDDFTVLINALQVDLDSLICSPPEAHLTGSFGNYTLYVKSDTPGEFTANVHLAYSPPLSAGNATNYTAAVEYFYTGINWTAANQLYIPTAAYNGTTWSISGVFFNVGIFTLGAETEELINISCAGLAYEPTFVYIEVYQISQ